MTQKRSRYIPATTVSLMALLVFSGCGGSTSSSQPTMPVEAPAPIQPETETHPDTEPESPPSPAVVILADVGFATPESVYFDRHRDVYLVSNINGSPTDKDKNGFISRLTPQSDGTYKIDLKFIDGSKKETRLDAPKGMTVVGDTLYVADIDRVRSFSAVTGSFRSEIKLPGSSFVNDVATGEGSAIYVSDSGLTPKFEPSGTDAVYKISIDGQVKKLISGPELGGPNGLIATPGGVWTTTFRSGELYWISDAGEKSAVQKMPQGQNDGIVFDGAGRMLISSWEGSSILAGPPEGNYQVSISGVTSPADIGFDCMRNRLLIPLFTEDRVVIQDLD